MNGTKKRGMGWVARTLFYMAVAGTFVATIVGGAVFWHFSRGLPKIITVEDYRPLTVTRVLGGGGREDMPMGEFYKERRYLVPYDKIPDVLVKAFISAEDDTFFEHQGINLVSIIRAAIANARAGHVVQGGSTITQQVAKSLLLTPERSFNRKIKELILANRIERNLTKQQILYLYLNQIYLGHGAYGVQAAAKTYFRKDVSELSIGEAALLAGMPQAPSTYSPQRNPKRAKERQLYVLRRMLENKHITREQMTTASAQPLRIYKDEDQKATSPAPYYLEHVRRYLLEKYGEKAVYEDGLTVSIPPTPQLSRVARKSVQEGLRAVDKRAGYRGPIKRLQDLDETEAFLKHQRLELIERRLGFSVLLPDGRIDPIEAIREAELNGDYELVEPGMIYQGVVTRTDDKAKVTGVMIGAIKADLPLDQMKWAKAYKDDKNSVPAYTVIQPSKVFQKGDVIHVRVVSTDEKSTIVALEQEPQVQGALLSLEALTGVVLAMEGGYEFTQSEFNRAIQAQRQPGSAFKPVIYAAGLEKGFTPASVIVDSPLVYDDGVNGAWKPDNFETKFYGDTTFRQALIKSRNVPTIKIVQAINVPFLIEYAKRLGMEGKFSSDLSISLGSGSVTLFDLTRTFALFPRLGRKVDPIFILSVRDRDGRVLEEREPQPIQFASDRASPTPSPVVVASPSPEPSSDPNIAVGYPSPSPLPTRTPVVFPQYPAAEDPAQVMDPRVAYVMTHLMKEVVNHGTGQEAKQLQRPAAGKTGTTNDYIDAWFMGFTPHVVTGAWVGYDSQKPVGHSETGARAALPIWLGFMREAVKAYPDSDFAMPPGVVLTAINPTNGKLAAPNSSTAIREAFIEGTEPTESTPSGPGAVDTASDFLKEDAE